MTWLLYESHLLASTVATYCYTRHLNLRSPLSQEGKVPIILLKQIKYNHNLACFYTYLYVYYTNVYVYNLPTQCRITCCYVKDVLYLWNFVLFQVRNETIDETLAQWSGTCDIHSYPSKVIIANSRTNVGAPAAFYRIKLHNRQ